MFSAKTEVRFPLVVYRQKVDFEVLPSPVGHNFFIPILAVLEEDARLCDAEGGSVNDLFYRERSILQFGEGSPISDLFE